MSVNYPKGVANPGVVKKKKKLNFKIAPGNRGLDFEADINSTNQYYLDKGLALVTKRPTPINVVKVDYSHGAKITQAYFETQSTTDYNGVYKGHYLDFEAKTTHSKTSFPLHNIPKQQISHLENVLKNGGIAFFIIEWIPFDETYILSAEFVIDFYKSQPRKSIPYSLMKEKGHLVKEGLNPRFDYLPVVEEFFL